jgi:hypothetical protein
MWFEQFTGFTEQGAALVRQMLSLENGVLTSRANGQALQVFRSDKGMTSSENFTCIKMILSTVLF